MKISAFAGSVTYLLKYFWRLPMRRILCSRYGGPQLEIRDADLLAGPRCWISIFSLPSTEMKTVQGGPHQVLGGQRSLLHCCLYPLFQQRPASADVRPTWPCPLYLCTSVFWTILGLFFAQDKALLTGFCIFLVVRTVYRGGFQIIIILILYVNIVTVV